MTVYEESTQKSFLVADCGSTNTTLVLFDIANGVYRFLARTTVPTTISSPWSDIAEGIRQAVRGISKITGRPLLNEQGGLIKPSKDDGSGVDRFAAVVSAAAPLEALLVGLFDEVSLASARHALNSTYVQEIDSFSLADNRDQQAQLAAILQHQPDLIFLVGGTDGGADKRLLQLIETVSLGVTVMSETKLPQVLYAGNINLREEVRQLLGDGANVQIANNVRPSLKTEQTDDAAHIMSELYDDIKINTLPGIQLVRSWSNYELIPTAQAFAALVEYLAVAHDGHVLGLDLGSDSVTLIAAEPQHSNIVVRNDLGMGRPIANLLHYVKPADIAHWTPTETSVTEVQNFIQNKALFPQTIPMTKSELYLERAIARAIVQNVFTGAAQDWGWRKTEIPPFKLLLVRGNTFAHMPHPGMILTLLDALQFSGIFSIALDQYGLLPALGVLSPHEPLVAVQALEKGALVDLGWVVVPIGKGQLGKKVVNITMETEQAMRLEIEVEYGEIEVLPLPADQEAEITLQPARGFDIGFGPGQKKTITLSGDATRLIVDARGRPPELPQSDIVARRTRLQNWLWDIGE